MVISIGSGRRKVPGNKFSSDILRCFSDRIAVYQGIGVSVGRISEYQPPGKTSFSPDSLRC